MLQSLSIWSGKDVLTLYLILYATTVPLGINEAPENITVIQASNVSLYCEFEGTDIVNITWISPDGTILQNNQSSITIQEGGLFPLNKSSSLNLENVSRSQNEGWYRCVCYTDTIFTEASAYLSIQGMVHAHKQQKLILEIL